MRGQVLGVDRRSGDGQIAGDDGRRYRFRPEDWSDRLQPTVGAVVDFEAASDRALSIYRLPVAANDVAPHQVYAQPTGRSRRRSKFVAASLALFLGALGAHRFYTDRSATGVLMFALSCTLIGLAATIPWAWIDFFRFLGMNHGEFERRYT
jgi:TM2 domain-containing membrane protein YozV